MAMFKSITVEVPHLFGTTASCRISDPYNPSKPTLVLVNSFTMTADLYDAQFKNEKLTSATNLLAIEPLGHGKTRTKSPTFTYWDTAIMNLQVLEALNIKPPVFALGTSQGGWIVVRMALLQPEKIAGIIPLGTSMDYESDRTRSLGCFDALNILAGPIQALNSATATPDFVIPEDFRNLAIYSGFGTGIDEASVKFWNEEMIKNYSGDDGRRRLREVSINLRDRDGLHNRLFEVRCPVLWMHGTADSVYSIPNAKEEIELFVNAKSKELVTIEDGQHYLSASQPDEVDRGVLEFVQKWS